MILYCATPLIFLQIFRIFSPLNITVGSGTLAHNQMKGGVSEMDRKKLRPIKDDLEELDIEIQCLGQLLDVVQLGMYAQYGVENDYDNFELSSVHILKHYINDLLRNNISDLKQKIENLVEEM